MPSMMLSDDLQLVLLSFLTDKEVGKIALVSNLNAQHAREHLSEQKEAFFNKRAFLDDAVVSFWKDELQIPVLAANRRAFLVRFDIKKRVPPPKNEGDKMPSSLGQKTFYEAQNGSLVTVFSPPWPTIFHSGGGGYFRSAGYTEVDSLFIPDDTVLVSVTSVPRLRRVVPAKRSCL